MLPARRALPLLEPRVRAARDRRRARVGHAVRATTSRAPARAARPDADDLRAASSRPRPATSCSRTPTASGTRRRVETGAWVVGRADVGHGPRPLPLGARSSPIPTRRCSRSGPSRRCARSRRSTTTCAGLGGYGLGLKLRRDGDRILAGHGGSMPGFIAGVYVSPTEKVGVAMLTNSSSAALGELGVQAARGDRRPVARPPEPWQVEEPPPDDVAPAARRSGSWRRRSSCSAGQGHARRALSRRSGLEAAGGVRARERRPLAHRSRVGATARRCASSAAQTATRAARAGGLPRDARAEALDVTDATRTAVLRATSRACSSPRAPERASRCGARATIRPSARKRIRSAIAAARASCVTITVVWPYVVTESRSRSRISPLVLESRLPVGSSAKSIVGRETSARAIATRCCWPPESSDGRACGGR